MSSKITKNADVTSAFFFGFSSLENAELRLVSEHSMHRSEGFGDKL